MPQVIHSFRGPTKNPRLKIPKGERQILESAAGLCKALSDSTAAYHSELSQEAQGLCNRLKHLAGIEELDLTKPF